MNEAQRAFQAAVHALDVLDSDPDAVILTPFDLKTLGKTHVPPRRTTQNSK
jgi:hypothetical protein